MKKQILLALFSVIMSSILSAAPKKHIAVIYAQSVDSGVAKELQCMTKAVLDDAISKGINLKYTILDNKRNAMETVKISEDIAQKNQYDAVVGTIFSSEGLAASKILSPKNIPFYVPVATHPEITQNKPNVIRLLFSDEKQAAILARYTAREVNPQRVSIITNVSKDYSIYLTEEYIKKIKELAPSIKIYKNRIVEGQTEFKILGRNIQKQDPDLLFFPIYGDQSAYLYRELAGHGKKYTIIGGDGIGGRKDWFDIVGETSKNISFTFVRSWNKRFDKNTETTYYKQLHKKYCPGFKHTFMTVTGYDITRILTKSVAKNKGEKLHQTSRNLNYDGVIGPVSFGTDGQMNRALNLFRIYDNKLNFYKRYE